MTKYVVNVDVGDLPTFKAEEYVKNVKESNNSFFGPNDKVFYLPNRKGYSSIETFASQIKQIYFTDLSGVEIASLQQEFDDFFGPKIVKVVYNVAMNGVITSVHA